MSSSDGGQLDPTTVLADASTRLRADGHHQLADDVARVDEYLRQLAVAHTEIALASDRVLEQGSETLRGSKDSHT